MSAAAGQWDDDDVDVDGGGEDQTQAMKSLRAAYKALKKERDTLAEQVSTNAKATRTSNLTTLLKARNLDAKIAAFVPEGIDATEDALDGWLKEYGDVFGVKQQEQQQQQSNLTDEQTAALRQMDVIAGATSSAQANDMLKQVQSAETPEALMALIESAGGGR